jgi:hypothetical protein
LVLNERKVLNVFHGRVDAADWRNDASSTYFVAGPEVPAESDSIPLFSLKEVHLTRISFNGNSSS